MWFPPLLLSTPLSSDHTTAQLPPVKSPLISPRAGRGPISAGTRDPVGLSLGPLGEGMGERGTRVVFTFQVPPRMFSHVFEYVCPRSSVVTPLSSLQFPISQSISLSPSLPTPALSIPLSTLAPRTHEDHHHPSRTNPTSTLASDSGSMSPPR